LEQIDQLQYKYFLQAALSIAIFLRLFYFLQLIDEMAPLIRIILLVLDDIIYFIVILVILVFAFSNSFYLMFKIQALETGESALDEESMNYPDYDSSFKAFIHVYKIALGDFQNDMYYETGDKNWFTLTLLWAGCSALLAVHLMNMLIAIMGDTFTINNDTKHITVLKQHLNFVLSNWYKKPIKNQERIRYLITATAKGLEDDDENNIQELIENQNQQETLIQDKFEDLNEQMDQNNQQIVKMVKEEIFDMKKQIMKKGEWN
jgi:hypothetical protein